MTVTNPPPFASELHEMSNDHRVLRLVVVLSPLISVFAAFAAAHSAAWWILIPVLGLSLVCAIQPDSHLSLLLIVVVTLYWIAAVDDRATAWTWVAAIGLALFHCAAAASTLSATAAAFPPAVRFRWLQRVAIVTGITGVAWCLQAAFDGHTFSGSATLFVAALVLLTGGALAARALALSRASRPQSRR